MMSSFTSHPIIKREAPDAVVYDLSEPHQVTITLPTGSTWSSGLHWHAGHAEHLRVIKGSIQVVLDGRARTISATDAEAGVRVGRGVWHEWGRAGAGGGGGEDEEVVVVERAEPEDGGKAVVLFWNLNGVALRRAQGLACPPYMPGLLHGILVEAWAALSLFAIFRGLDSFPVFVNVPRAFSKRGFIFAENTLGHNVLRGVDVMITRVLLLLASGISLLFGITAVRDEFTPDEVRQNWIASQTERRTKKA